MGVIKTKLADFNRETGKATYIYSYRDKIFVGEATCHEDDMDMCSEMVGLKYAEARALLQVCKARKYELQIRLKALEGALRDMATSNDFDFLSTYARKIQNSICDVRCELNEVKEAINNIPPYLKKDMEGREALYKRIRAKREEEDEKSAE